jgi:origin recognition complex subunit 2
VDEDEDEGVFRGQDARLAREILDSDEHTDEDDIEEADPDRYVEVSVSDTEATGTGTTPTPRKRGRPRTRTGIKTGTRTTKPPRSPTPDGDIPPEERYFYQNRPGAPQVSGNRFNSIKLLTQEEYFEQISSWKDPHASEKAFLSKLHARAFPQWKFELEEGYGLCLYGYGSKRSLVTQFAEWLYKRCTSDSTSAPQIVILNGYVPKLNIRSILNTIAAAATGGAEHEHENEDDHDGPKLTGQPEEMLDSLLAHLTANLPPQRTLYVMVNSIDGSSLRRAGIQSLLARLAAHPAVHFVCTADSTAFPAMWNSTHLEHFRFVYHDCTTFAPYEAETEIGNEGVLDQVHELLGRKRSRVGGKEGVGYVLKSLPENAKNLYRLLLSEILTLMDDGPNNWEGTTPDVDAEGDDDEDQDEGHDQDSESRPPRTPTRKKRQKKKKVKVKVADPSAAEEVGVEYRALYRKASEEFICSSAMNFQFLLKEFLDHQMITSRRDGGSGAEMLGVPLGREEMEGVLEELV